MKPGTVRTSVDIPKDLHRRLRAAAARKGCSARQLILQGIESQVATAEPASKGKRLNLDPPIIPSRGGPPFDLTNEQIYELIDFP